MRNMCEKSKRKVRFQALVIVIGILMGACIVGCQTKTDKGNEDSDDQRSAQLVVEDFCDFLGGGKLNRVGALLDDESDMLKQLQDYQQSPASGVLNEFSSQMKYRIKNVSIDQKEETGTAKVVFTVADPEEVSDQIAKNNTSKEIRQIIEGIETEDHTFELELIDEDGWHISSDSADEVIEVLFSFMEDLDIDTAPTTVATPTPVEYDIFVAKWYDDYYNEVDAYEQTDTTVILMIITWNSFEYRDFSYTFKDEAGNTLYVGTVHLVYGDSTITCNWEEASLVGLNTLYCTVYDQDSQEVYSTSIHIYGEDEEVPVRYHVSSLRLVDQDGNYVPGYYEGETYVGVRIEIVDMKENIKIPYGLYTMDYDLEKDFNVALFEGTMEADRSVVIFPFEDLPPLAPGQYFFQTFKPDGSMKDIIFFDVKTEGETFKYSVDETAVLDQYFTFEAGEIQNKRDVSSGTETIYFEMELPFALDYVGFTYTLTDSSGKVLDEGKQEIFYSDRCSIKLNMSGAAVGEMTIKVYNPNGKELTSYSIEVTE